MSRPLLLRPVRRLIDGVDDALVLLLAARGRLAAAAARGKRRAGLPPRDPDREAAIHARAQRLAARVGVPAATASALMDLSLVGAAEAATDPSDQAIPQFLLHLIPPPNRLAPLLKHLPKSPQARFLEQAMARVLATSLAAGHLEFLRNRRLGIEVTDLGLHWVIGLHGDRVAVVGGTPEASVRGSATDLLLLAARQEDADTLFFQRRLVLTGDTELGLAARNLLEGLPWASVPLGLRIGLDRGARLAHRARAAHAGRPGWRTAA
ncbi:SCP2 sterol-binding domain-containing protein [Xenophilus sp.]|uniref:ubiquinone anaerobic biosynthesis accessory factor UbiT n=1 Tax=Xenophilus sp. TaxID=1873499 RepID=UPI0037DC87A4